MGAAEGSRGCGADSSGLRAGGQESWHSSVSLGFCVFRRGPQWPPEAGPDTQGTGDYLGRANECQQK